MHVNQPGRISCLRLNVSSSLVSHGHRTDSPGWLVRTTQPRLHFAQKQNIHLEVRQLQCYREEKKKLAHPFSGVSRSILLFDPEHISLLRIGLSTWNADSISAGQFKLACHVSNSVDLGRIRLPAMDQAMAPTAKGNLSYAAGKYKTVTLPNRFGTCLCNTCY